MASDRVMASNNPLPTTMYPSFDPVNKRHTNIGTIYNMSGASSTPSLNDTVLPVAMNGLSLHVDSQATPTPKDKKSLSETSLSTMTPPDSARGVLLVPNGTGRLATANRDKFLVKAQADDDVFGQSSSTTPNQSANGQANNATAVATIQPALPNTLQFQQTPRADRMNSPITPANAQGVLPPEACLFVANLPTSTEDQDLEVLCSQHFETFGRCHIKVRRDRHRHPFAMVQYHTIAEANDALRASNSVEIAGRPIRVEQAQARRSVVLTKIGGGAITVEEAKIALENFGPISKMRPTTHQDAHKHGVPEGLWVEFAYYLDYKDAIKSFNSSTADYRIHVPPEHESLGTSAEVGHYRQIRGFRNPRSTTDQKSIFVGNLPHDTTEEYLRQLFCECGAIRAVNIIHKPIHGGTGFNVFGFIEFNSIEEAEVAASFEVELNGVKIRVEPKEYSARRHVRLQNYGPAMSPYHLNQRQNYGSGWGGSPGGSYGYKPNYYTMQSPSRYHHAGTYNPMQNVAEMSPFHQVTTPHHQNNFSSIYATPPPSARVGLRRNDMVFTPSPHHIATWSPYINTGAYAGGAMMQIPEEMEGQRF